MELLIPIAAQVGGCPEESSLVGKGERCRKVRWRAEGHTGPAGPKAGLQRECWSLLPYPPPPPAPPLRVSLTQTHGAVCVSDWWCCDGPCLRVCVMVLVLAGVKELGRAAALAQRTGCVWASLTSLGEEGGGGQEEPGWEAAQAQGWGLMGGPPLGYW